MNYDWYTSWRHGFTICNCYAIQPGCTLEALLRCYISLQNLPNLTHWLSTIIPKLLLWSRAPYKTKGEIKDVFSPCKTSLAYPILELRFMRYFLRMYIQPEVKYYPHFPISLRSLDVSEWGPLKPKRVTPGEHLRPRFPGLQSVPHDPRNLRRLTHVDLSRNLHSRTETSAFGDTGKRWRYETLKTQWGCGQPGSKEPATARPKATTRSPGPQPRAGNPSSCEERRDRLPTSRLPAPLSPQPSAPPPAAAHEALAPNARKARSARNQREAARKGNAPSRTTQSRPFCTFFFLATWSCSPLSFRSHREAPQGH